MTHESQHQPGADSGDPATQSELRHLTKDESEDLDRARRGEKTRKILQNADVRDAEATARDAVADERARVADLKAFTDPSTIYPGQDERRAAAHDRADSKTDREFSAEHRARLTEGDH